MRPSPGMATPEVKARPRQASQLLKLQLVSSPGAGFDALFAQTVRDLHAAGRLRERDARLEVTYQGR